MEFPFSPHIRQVPFPPIAEVQGWIAGRRFPPERPLVDLCQAVPDYPPAPELLAHLAGVLNEPQTSRYSVDEGLVEAREAVAAWYRRRYGAGPSTEQLCLTIGASQAFWLAMTVLCRAGDEVILQAPCYFDHAMGLQALGIKPVFAPFREETGGLPDPEVLAALVTPRTRAFLLVTPSNPTGAVIPPSDLQALLDLARQKRIALVLDETYNGFLEAPPHDLFADPDWGGQLVHLASFGKTFALTGYRAGALAAGEEFLRQALKVQDTMAVCQPRITQQALLFACRQLDGWVAANRAMMQRRHDRFRAAFSRAGNPFALVASGGFFAWVRHPFADCSGREAARRLAVEANLICLPGEAFGPDLHGYLRLAFGNIREEAAEAAVERFRGVSEA